jgi:hypothetical protein
MAESVRYRGGRVNLSVPEQTAFEAQAAQRGSQLVAQSIDRMVSFFRQQSIEKAKVEAVEYGSANAPTAEQIEQARESGEELKLPGDNNTLFGRLARQAAASTVSDTIELAARQEINSALLDAQARRLNPADLQDKLDAIILGYSSSFDETVPSMSRALNAKLSVTANSKYTNYHSSYIAQARADGKAAFMTNLLTTLSSEAEGFKILNAQKTDANGNVIPGEVDLNALVASKLLEASARDFTASEIKTLETLMTTKLVNTANQTLTNSILKAPNANTIIKALGRGEEIDFKQIPEAETALSILRQSGLSDSEIASELRRQRTEQINFDEKVEQEKNKNADRDEDLYIGLALDGIANNDKKQASDALIALESLNYERAVELRNSWLSRPGIQYSDPTTVERLDNMRDRITINDVVEVFADLNQADQEKYYDKAKALDQDDLRLAKNIIKGQLNLPENIDLIQKGDPNYKNAQLYNRARAELEILHRAAATAETDFDPFAATQQVLDSLQGDFEDVTKKIQKQSAMESALYVYGQISGRKAFSGFMNNSKDLQGAIDALNQLKATKKKERPRDIQDDERIQAFLDVIQRGIEASE